jgi:GH25 family lysozyme M1 (1,4-beta-N-acetylmuramidase)
MKQLLFVKFLQLVEKLTGKKIVYLPKERFASNLTAVKSDAGFWYCGNLTARNCIVYSICRIWEAE